MEISVDMFPQGRTLLAKCCDYQAGKPFTAPADGPLTGGEITMKSRFSSLLALTVIFSCVGTAGPGPQGAGPNPAMRDHLVRIVTVSQEGLDVEGNNLLEPTLELLDRAASFRPDIACLPEHFSGRTPQTVPGPVTDRLAAWAREHSSYVAFGMITKKDGKIHNSAILMDRQGQIVGQYNKLHPTDQEIKRGILPGEDAGLSVFKTDFGTIGLQICFDVNWRDEWRKLKEHGAQLVIWPSAYPAAMQLPALALTNEYFIISSTGRASASIYDITGQVLATTGVYQEWAGAVLPLSKRLFETDYNGGKVAAIQKKYGAKVEVVWFHDSDLLTMASLDPALTMEDLMAEFALTPLDAYIARCTKAIDQARSEVGGKAHATQRPHKKCGGT